LGFGVDVDFGDAYLAATAAEHSDKIATFDDDFGAFSDVVADHPR
jgi:predicted nucleic acid-binding protein